MSPTPDTAPLVSVAMPTFDTDLKHLSAAIVSVLVQTDSRWELCIADDRSRRSSVRETLRAFADADPRIRVELLDRNAGISGASNRAVAACRGEYVAFLDHDDALAPEALGEVARALAADPVPDVIYTDQDKLDRRGRRVAPFRKPDWSPVYALGAMYLGHLLVVRRSLLLEAGGFDPAFDTIQDFELLLRLSERTDRIRHVGRVLYHWRAVQGSIAAGVDEKPGIPDLQAAAVTAHLERRGIAARAAPHREIPHRARLVPEPRSEHPTVSVIVARRGDDRALERCLASISERTRYPRVETIVAEPDTSPPAAANRAARTAAGEHLLFLAGDTEVLATDWIERLLMYAEIPTVGIVGPLLVHPDGRVHEAGLTVRRRERNGGSGEWWHGRGPAEPLMAGAGAADDGYYGSLSCAREVGAVSDSCMLIGRSLFEGLGGFSEEYRSHHHDVDLCLRARERGEDVVYAPEPRVLSYAPARPPREDVLDRALLVDSWFEQLERGDPYLDEHLDPAMR